MTEPAAGCAPPPPAAAALLLDLFRTVDSRSEVLVRGAGESLTYGRLAELSYDLAAVLRAAGAVTGSVVDVFLPPGGDFLVALTACVLGGHVFRPAAGAPPGAAPGRGVRVVADPRSICPGRFYSGSSYPSGFGAEVTCGPGGVVLGSPGFIRETSGTTGRAKGVFVSAAAAAARALSAADGLDVRPGETVCSALPLTYHFVTTVLAWLSRGCRVVLADERSPSAALRHSGATLFFGAPHHFEALASAPAGTRLRAAYSTTAPLAPGAAQRFFRAYGTWPRPVLGIFEAGFVMAGGPEGPAGGGMRPLPGVEVKTVTTGPRRGSDEEGVLWVRSPGLFGAYLDPYTPSAAACRDGWFVTGDVARRRPDGGYELAGRADSAMNVAGHKVFPEEVEAVLSSHPAVRTARVYAERHRIYGEVVCAELEAGSGNGSAGVSEGALRTFLRDRLERHKVPQRIRWVEAVPRTQNGKVARAGRRAAE